MHSYNRIIEFIYNSLFPAHIVFSLDDDESDEITPGFVMAIVVFFVITLYSIILFHPSAVSGYSMYPTLDDGDLLLNREISENTDISRGDIVIFAKQDFFNGENLVKRVVGMPGDLMELENGQVYINGQLYHENYLVSGTVTEGIIGQYKIPQGHYFMMGDNRDGSSDSRVFGYVALEECKYKVVRYYNYPKLPGQEAKAWIIYNTKFGGVHL